MMFRLYDGKLLRRLKVAVKARTRRSSRKSARGKWWKVGRGSNGKWIWLVWLLANLARIVTRKPGNGNPWNIDLLNSMSLAFFGLALSRARKLAALLTVGVERRVLSFYPLPERDFFRWTARRFLASNSWIAAVAAIVYFLATTATDVNGWTVRIAGPLVEWLTVLGIAIALARYVHYLPRWLPMGFYISAGLALVGPEPYGKAMASLSSALPTGWLHDLLTIPLAKESTGWLTVFATLALGFLCWLLLKHLERIYCREEISAMEADLSPALDSQNELERLASQAQAEQAEATEAANEEATDEAGAAALPMQAAWQKQRFDNWGSQVGEILRAGHWLQGWNWNAMRPIERTVGWCLREREKSDAQFLLGPVVPNWSTRWRTAAIATAVGVAAVAAGMWEFNIISALAFAVSIGSGLPVLGGAWPAANQGKISGKFSPIFGCYPLSYWTAGWIMFKANTVRTAAWIPLALMIGVLNARTADTTIASSCWWVARGILLFLDVQPILLAGKISKVTNDTSNMRLRTIPLLGLFVMMILVVVGLGAGVFMASGWWPVIFLGGVAVLSWVSWAAYGWYYERGQVDLLREQA
jgi:hypothetical protein